MTEERTVVIEEKLCTVTISDEQEALLAAYAAGGAIVGIWNQEEPFKSLAPAEYVVESLEDADDAFLERVARRRLGLPWIIAQTERLVIREFMAADGKNVEADGEETGADQIFQKEETLKAYIDCQYRFFEWGIWAVVEKSTGRLVGKAGISAIEWDAPEAEKKHDTALELGYHVFSPYRRRGYAAEACKAVLDYVKQMQLADKLYAVIERNNTASLHLIKCLGFQAVTEADSELTGQTFLYEWSCPESPESDPLS